jgi:hypothetical protein
MVRAEMRVDLIPVKHLPQFFVLLRTILRKPARAFGRKMQHAAYGVPLRTRRAHGVRTAPT